MENGPRLEVHYYLQNGSHSMDAFVRNRCEAEFLHAVSYIAKSLGADLQFESTRPAEGGFRDIWKVLLDKDNRAVPVPTMSAILTLVVTQAVVIWNAPPKADKELERQQLEINRLTIEHWKLENERSALELQKLQKDVNGGSSPASAKSRKEEASAIAPAAPQIQVAPSPSPVPSTLRAIEAEGETKVLGLQMAPKVNKHRSNFYKQLIPDERVTAVGFRWVPDDKPPPEERVISRPEFSSFVMQTDTLEPEVTEAVIEIVSPVITEGDIQWKGRWNGKAIAFAMDDRVFKEQVFRREVSFQHGDSIQCVLESERKLDEGGNPKITHHRVTTVLGKVESGGKTHETPQGRRKRFEAKHSDGQSDLFKSAET